jgi:hypothetical protein
MSQLQRKIECVGESAFPLLIEYGSILATCTTPEDLPVGIAFTVLATRVNPHIVNIHRPVTVTRKTDT